MAIVSGTGTLVGNTVGGVFGMFSQITGSLGTGVKKISGKIDE